MQFIGRCSFAAGKPDVHQLAFDERFGMLVDAEWLHRENKRIATALRDAKLRLTSACIEDIDYPAHRELDRAQIRQLASAPRFNRVSTIKK